MYDQNRWMDYCAVHVPVMVVVTVPPVYTRNACIDVVAERKAVPASNTHWLRYIL